MACCHDPLPRRNPPSPGCVISFVGFGASPSGLVHKPSMAPQPTLQTGARKGPGLRDRGKNCWTGGNWGCSAVQRHDLNVRRPVWFLSLAKDVVSPQPPATIPQGLQNMPFHNPTTQLPTPCPLGYFLPLDLAPFRRGFFLGTAQKKSRAGPCSTMPTLGRLFASVAGRRIKAPSGLSLPRLGPHSEAEWPARPPPNVRLL